MKKGKRAILLLCVVHFAHITLAQNWPGYETGRFSGISSANERPGGMAPTPYKVDATLAGVHLFSQTQNLFQNNDAIGLISSGGFQGLKGFAKLRTGRTSIYSNLQGPSVLVGVNPKFSLAFTWNMRFLWTSGVSNPEIAQLFDKDVSHLNLSNNGETATTLFNSWNELGLGAGGQVFKKFHHSLSVGGFIKLVLGTGNINFQMDNLDMEVSDSIVKHIGFNLQAVISSQTYDLVDEGKLKLFDRMGYGFDFGAEWRFENPRSCPGASNYMLKAGFSLTDMGQMNYNSALQYANITVSADSITLDRFRNAETFRAAMDTLKGVFKLETSPAADYKVTLPMSLRLYADYNFGNRLCIYNEFQFMFVKMMNPGATAPVTFRYNLTPRFEDYRFGIYLPLTFSNYIPANAGLALRWKPFIIGSGNLFTFWIYDDIGKPMDIYLTIKIPIVKDDQRIDYSNRKKR